MRKPLAISLVLSSIPIGSAAFAAPETAKCNWGAPAAESGCFFDDVLIVKGDEVVTATTQPPAAMPGGPLPPAVTTMVPLVACGPKDVAKPDADITDCYLGKTFPPNAMGVVVGGAEYLQADPVERAVQKALELARAKGQFTQQWDQIVVFNADFGPTNSKTKQHAPLFYRATNAMLQGINEVGGLGLPKVPRDPNKPYVGFIAAGNSKSTVKANEGSLGACKDKDSDVPVPSICFADVYNYFDALAQATGNLYGPYLPGGLSTLPLNKTVLVTPGGGSGTDSFPPKGAIQGGPSVNVWNGLLNTGGSILGGNTFRNKGNGTWEVAKPTAFQGVSAPFEKA